MPVLPAEIDDVCQIAATDEVEQQIVTLDQPSRTAGFHFIAKHQTITFISNQLDTGQRYAILQVHSYKSARLFDLIETLALGPGHKPRQMIAQAATSATLTRSIGVIRILLSVAATASATIAGEFALELAATLRAWNRPQ